MSTQLEVHTVLFHPPRSGGEDDWLAEARNRDMRFTMASSVIDIVSIIDAGGLICFPAGYFHATTVDGCALMAERMRTLATQSGCALIFGCDVNESTRWAPLETPPESFAFACQGDQPLLWPAHRGRGLGRDEGPAERRTITLAGMRVGVVIGFEAFNGPLRSELTRDRPDVIVLLTHVGINERWRHAISGLSSIAPVIVCGESRSGAGSPAWTAAPDGWSQAAIGATDSLTLHRYLRPPLAERGAAWNTR